jgi:hypothetical protein
MTQWAVGQIQFSDKQISLCPVTHVPVWTDGSSVFDDAVYLDCAENGCQFGTGAESEI